MNEKASLIKVDSLPLPKSRHLHREHILKTRNPSSPQIRTEAGDNSPLGFRMWGYIPH